jgi:hypothetical protein
MPYRSRKQDRDQAIERRIADSYKGYKRKKPQHKPDTKALEIMEQNPGMTYSEALDELIKAELAELNNKEGENHGS